MKISEIFESIQGEGVNARKESIFIRTALCNLKCSWCDTKYTWDWKNFDYDTEVHELSIDEILQKLENFTANNIVITGGEPLMQQEELISLILSFPKKFFIEIETNGTILPLDELVSLIDQWNVSPKTSNSNNLLEQCEIVNCYNFFKNNPKTFFKFVVDTKSDILEIIQLVKKYNIDKSKIILMPQATTKDDLVSKESLIQDLCEKNGFRYTTRLHVLKWGNARGR